MRTQTEPKWRERARALKAADPSRSHRSIAAEVGVTQSSVTKALNPERAREWERQSNAKGRRRKQEWENEYNRSERVRGRCSRCGGLRGIGAGRRSSEGLCQACIAADHERLWRRIEELWNAGLPYPELCAALSWAKGTLAGELDKMRKAGRDVPHRYNVNGRRHTPAPNRGDS